MDYYKTGCFEQLNEPEIIKKIQSFARMNNFSKATIFWTKAFCRRYKIKYWKLN